MQHNRVHLLPAGAILIHSDDAKLLLKVLYTAVDLAARHGARLNSEALLLAEQIRSVTGQMEQATMSLVQPMEYERIDAATAAQILECSPRNVRALAARGRLPGDKQGNRWWFNRDDVEVYKHFHDRPYRYQSHTRKDSDG